MSIPFHLGEKGRLMLVGLLGSAVILLLLLNLAAEKQVMRRRASVPSSIMELKEIDASVVRLLGKHNLRQKSIKTRNVQTPAGQHVRVERQVSVSPDFGSLEFNRELSNTVRPFGARAIAAEQIKERRVTIHVLKEGSVVQSIVFVMTRDRDPGSHN